jgi:hypothetical protein
LSDDFLAEFGQLHEREAVKYKKLLEEQKKKAAEDKAKGIKRGKDGEVVSEDIYTEQQKVAMEEIKKSMLALQEKIQTEKMYMDAAHDDRKMQTMQSPQELHRLEDEMNDAISAYFNIALGGTAITKPNHDAKEQIREVSKGAQGKPGKVKSHPEKVQVIHHSGKEYVPSATEAAVAGKKQDADYNEAVTRLKKMFLKGLIDGPGYDAAVKALK